MNSVKERMKEFNLLITNFIKEKDEFGLEMNNYFERVIYLKKQLDINELRVTIVGEFSAGKSTFLNALIGKDILPHALNETTATVTYIHNVSKGDKNEGTIVINFKNNKNVQLNIKQNYNILKEYVTTQSSKYNVSNEISSVDIYINFYKFDEKIVFIDTPGLNGVADKHRDITMNEIERAHASIYIFHLRSITKSNLLFLKILLKYQKSFIFVINFIDELKITENETYDNKIKSFAEQLSSELSKFQEVQLMKCFGVSSLMALASKDKSIKRLYDNQDEELTKSERKKLWEKSRFSFFEDYLWGNLLKNEKRRIFEESVYSSFESILIDMKEELINRNKFFESNVDKSEINIIENKKVNAKNKYDRNWSKIVNYIRSEEYELDKFTNAKIKMDMELIYINISELINKTVTFEELEKNYSEKKYTRALDENIGKLVSKYNKLLEEKFNNIFQLVLLRIEQYSEKVSINANGNIVFDELKTEFGNNVIEGKIQLLEDKKESLFNKKEKINSNNLKMSLEIDKTEKGINKNKKILTSNEDNYINEIRKLGTCPEVEYRTKTIKKMVERAPISIFRLFGSEYKEIEETVNVKDTSKRDSWNRKIESLEYEYNEKKDKYDSILYDLKERKNRLKQKQNLEISEFNRVEKRIKKLHGDLKNAKNDYEYFKKRAKSEYLSVKKNELLNELNIFLYNKVKIDMIESISKNMKINIENITKKAKIHFEQSHINYMNKLNIMLNSEKSENYKEMDFINNNITVIEKFLKKNELLRKD